MPEHNDDNTRTFVPLTKGTMISHYRIAEKIGAGGMGEVYLAEDTELDRRVALKFLPSHLCQDDDCRTRFKREAQAVAKLNHPNIVTIFEVSEYNGRPFFAMELVEGQSLRDLAKGKELGIDRILELAIQICDGLGAAHDKKIVHRDIKPSNIVIDAYGRPKILDFGLAAVQGGEDLTKTGSTLGTVRYMSPEQVRGREVDQRSDLFSLGVVLYELIAGRTPFEKENEAATLKAITQDNPEPLTRYKSDVPAGMQSIIDKALDRDLETRYQTAAGIMADLKREKKAVDSGASVSLETAQPSSLPQKKSRLRYIVSGSVVGIIVLLLLIFKPWTFEVTPTQEAVAAENRLAVLYFDNLADPADSQRLGEIAATLLISDLSESEYIRVVSSQRLYDILKQLGREGIKKIDHNVATQIAKKAHAGWMITGSILQTDPRLIITVQLVEVGTGNVIASPRITGDTGETIFDLVDKLTVEIKTGLSLPTAAANEPDPQIADVTTHSPEAYRYYLEGIDYSLKFYWSEATERFEKAIEHDSSFAMAYFRLALLATGQDKEKHISRALKLIDHVTQTERWSIKAVAANIRGDKEEQVRYLKKIIDRNPFNKEVVFALGRTYRDIDQSDSAITYWTKAIEIDPQFKGVYNELAYHYSRLGNHEKSLWAINKYIELAPQEANPYDSRGDLYAFSGRIDQAIASYKQALKIKPDFYLSLGNLGNMYLFKNEYDDAAICFQELSSADEKGSRSLGRLGQALIPLHQGKLEQAVKIAESGLGADELEQYKGVPSLHKHALKSLIYTEQKNRELATIEARKAVNLAQQLFPSAAVNLQDFLVHILAENGQIEKAEEVAQALRKDIDEKDPTSEDHYWLAMGGIASAKGNTDAAVNYLERAVVKNEFPFFPTQSALGKAYLDAGRLAEAVAVFEKSLSMYDPLRAVLAISNVKLHYFLGLAYEKSGWNKKAIEQYEEFLDIWKDADPGITEIDDAKQRLARLKSKS